MNAGLYRNKIVIQKYVQGYNDVGSPLDEWQNYKTVYAYVNGLSGSEYWEAANIRQENTVEFVCRWKPFFDEMNTKQFRIIFNDSIYNINTIDNVQFRNKTVKLKGVTKDGTEG